MEITAYPVPYFVPTRPAVTEVQPGPDIKSGLPSRQNNRGLPEDRVFQGEVLDDGRQTSRRSQDRRFNYEEYAARSQPDLSNVPAAQRDAIQAYLENEDLGTLSYNVRPLIDDYA